MLELILRRASAAASTLTSNCNLSSSIKKPMAPPLARKSGVSPTVSTLAPSSTLKIFAYRLASDRLTKRIWQAWRSCSLRAQRTSTARPRTAVPLVISARVVPKEKSPNTQRRSGACWEGKASGGHSMNLGKAARKVAFARYSSMWFARASGAGKGTSITTSKSTPMTARTDCSVKRRFLGSRWGMWVPEPGH